MQPENKDATTQAQLLPLGQQPVAEAPAVAVDPVEDWLEQNPVTKEFNAESQPQAEKPAEIQPPQEIKPGEVMPPQEIKPGDKKAEAAPGVKATVEQPAKVQADKPQAEVAEQPPVKGHALDLNAKYTLVEGAPEWTGEQILSCLREFQPLEQKAQMADTYKEIFGLDAPAAKEAWGPVMESLRRDPANVELFAACIDDPDRAAYLRDCSKYFDSPEARAIRTQAQPQATASPVDPQLKAQVDSMQAEIARFKSDEQSRKQRYFTDRVTREMNQVVGQYPFLSNRPELLNDLLMTANALNGGDDSENSKGILDALALKKPLYDAMLIASQQPAITQPAPAVEVPPLLGSAGAAPQATRPQTVRPKSFSSLEDAVDDWVQNAPSQFR